MTHRRGSGPTLAESLIAIGVPAEIVLPAAQEFYRDRRFGEELVTKGLITKRQLLLALAHQSAARNEFIAARAYAAEAGGDLDILIEKHVTTLHNLVVALGKP